MIKLVTYRLDFLKSRRFQVSLVLYTIRFESGLQNHNIKTQRSKTRSKSKWSSTTMMVLYDNAEQKSLRNSTTNASSRPQSTTPESTSKISTTTEKNRLCNTILSTPRSYFRQQHYDVIDIIITQLNHGFEQKSIKWTPGDWTKVARHCEWRELLHIRGCLSKLQSERCINCAASVTRSSPSKAH